MAGRDGDGFLVKESHQCGSEMAAEDGTKRERELSLGSGVNGVGLS